MELTRLTRSELLQLVNGTERGAVLSRGRLRGQLDAGGRRFCGEDGRVHFLRYVRWLGLEHDRRREEAQAAATAAAAGSDGQAGEEAGQRYIEARVRQAARNRAATRAAQDIAPIPDVENWPRRLRCMGSLREFCETYAASAFCGPWSQAHLAAIRVLEDLADHGGQFALAMPRGSGKTTLARYAALWMLLSGRAGYVVGIGSVEEQAERNLLAPVKKQILENRLLLADFPEAIYALRCLENSSKRQLQQHCGGQLTHVRWESDRIVFPTLPEESLPASFRAGDPARRPAAQGAVYDVDSLEGEIRGHQYERPDGTVLRPELVILDDPQTRKSARSAAQTDGRMELINGDIRYLAGPDRTITMVALCTVIYQGDLSARLLDRDHSPDWQGQCTRFLDSFPANLRLWEEYWQLRRGRGSLGVRESNAYYRRHRADMDAGASVSWEYSYDRRTELSALQHAMNLWLANPASFYAEYQNDPRGEQLRDDVLRAAQVTEKTNGRARGQVPAAASRLTAFIDIHDELLFWLVCAWEADLTGYVIDYGAWPEQNRRWFTLAQASDTLTRKFRGRSTDAAIRAGLEELVLSLTRRDWARSGGGTQRLDRLNVDMGYKAEIVEAVKHAVGGGETIWLAKGVGLKAGHKPMAEYKRRPGELHGCHWYVPNVRGTREFRHVAVDVNYWKTFVHAALAAPQGEHGGMSLFGSRPADHELFAEHVANSETWVATSGRGRTVHEWTSKPGRPDNHWLDCLVGCAAAASQCGAAAPGQEAGGQTGRKRYTQADLQRRG